MNGNITSVLHYAEFIYHIIICVILGMTIINIYFIYKKMESVSSVMNAYQEDTLRKFRRAITHCRTPGSTDIFIEAVASMMKPVLVETRLLEAMANRLSPQVKFNEEVEYNLSHSIIYEYNESCVGDVVGIDMDTHKKAHAAGCVVGAYIYEPDFGAFIKVGNTVLCKYDDYIPIVRCNSIGPFFGAKYLRFEEDEDMGYVLVEDEPRTRRAHNKGGKRLQKS